ncbi:hypothetical protein [Nocardioides sp.]|uniref:hypothetical protein n=1 Tax=Nocardioides sp. TaxID=35761 RepID=UPI0026064CE2|nr:hypothetical protein [Nocardioides sp.]
MRRGDPGPWIGGAVAALTLVLALGMSGTLSTWTTATVSNTLSRAGAATVALTHAYSGGPCVGGVGVSTLTCPPTLGTAASPPTTVSDTITNNGTAALTQSVTGVSCGVVQLANTASAADPLLPRNAVAFARTDPWGGASALTLSGSGYATDPVGTTGTGLLGLLQSSFSIGVWFKAADAQGGGLLSLSASPANGTGTGAGANPALWLDSSGKVNASVSTTGSRALITSSGTYSSGWHFAVLTVTSVLVIASVTLYVDGVAQGTSGGLTLATSVSGYWHLGWADFTGQSAGVVPTSTSFHGSLSGAFVVGSTALSSAQVTTLNGSASAAAFQSTVTAQGASSLWMLGDTGTTTTSATLPTTMTAPCGQVQIGLVFATPAATVATMSLASFANGSARAVAAPAVGQSQTLTLTLTKASGYSTDVAGLHLYVPLSFAYTSSPGTGWTQTLRWVGDPAEVFWA